jgi:hypothetical protein
MTKGNSLRLPAHRLSLLDFWAPKTEPKFAKAHTLISKVIVYKLTKEELESGKEVPPHIEADKQDAAEQLIEALVSNVPFLEELLQAAKENERLWRNGLGQDLRRKIIWAYSQLYYESNPFEPTREQLRERISKGGVKFTKRAFNAYLKELGLDDLKSNPRGRPSGKRK